MNFWEKITEWSLNTGIRIVIALVVLVISWYVINLVAARILKKQSGSDRLDKTVVRASVNIIKTVLKVLVVLSLVSYLGINTSGITAVLASFGVGIGLAVNGSLANLAGGIVILFTRPFKVDDYIRINDVEGRVLDIQLINTKLLTLDNSTIYMPNSMVSSATVINYTEAGKRRMELVFPVAYGDDCDKAIGILKDVCKGADCVLTEPETRVFIKNYGSSSIDICCWIWVNSADYWHVYYDIIGQVKAAYDKEGLTIPFEQLDVHVIKD